jgi:hypothetical protein
MMGAARRRKATRWAPSAAWRLAALGPIGPTQSSWRTPMAKHPKPNTQVVVTAIMTIDFQRVRWIEPILRGPVWWPVPKSRRSPGGR